MRLLLPALALAALPAAAQDAPRPERQIVITIDSTDRAVRIARPHGAEHDVFFHVAPGDHPARFRLGPAESLRAMPGERVMIRRFERDGEVEADTIRFRVPDVADILQRFPQEGGFEWDREGGPFEVFVGEPGLSPETRDRMRDLDRRSRELAREARDARGAERTRLERELDGVLDELFEVRADARRERAAHLRERAETLEADARALEEGLRERDARRREILEARRRELLGEDASADW